MHNPAEFPRESRTRGAVRQRPIIVPKEYVGAVMELVTTARRVRKMEYLSPERVLLHYELPLAEIVLDFFDQLKSRTRATRPSTTTSRLQAGRARQARHARRRRDGRRAVADHPPGQAYDRGRCSWRSCGSRSRARCSTSPIQAAIGARIIARETLKAKRKDVPAKCYGGDISRKRKLLEKQKEGKKRMKQIGRSRCPGGVPRRAQHRPR